MQLTIKNAASFLQVQEKKIYQWIESQNLPATRVDGQYRINKSLLIEWATTRHIPVSPHLFAERGEDKNLPTLLDSVKVGGIHYNIVGTNKTTVLKSVVDLLHLPDSVDRDFLFSALWARESLQSTAVGDGIAFPHVRNPMILDIEKPIVSLGFLETPIDFGALDDQPVRILFTLMTPTVGIHLHLLSRLAFVCRNPEFKKILYAQGSREEIFAAIQKAEENLAQQSADKGSGD